VSREKFLLLATLYLSQGLPYGFFSRALPALMREQKASLEAIGLSPAAARTVVEGRLFGGRYTSVDEALAAPGLSAREREALTGTARVR